MGILFVWFGFILILLLFLLLLWVSWFVILIQSYEVIMIVLQMYIF